MKKQKEKPVEKSLLVLDVKPWEADTDLEVSNVSDFYFQME